jgi:phosphoglycerate kinase
MQKIENYDFSGKKVIMRVDFNVPLDKETYEVKDDTRIKGALPSIKKILEKGGAAILMSHLGRPKGDPEEKFSLKHVIPRLSELLGKEVKFADDCIGESAQKQAAGLQPGEVLLLENLRFHNEEKKGDKDFAKKLADLADVYVNDAFGTAHRAHASTTIIAEFFPNDKMFGYLIENELESMEKVLKSTDKPFTAIMGGAKVSDKIIVIEKLIEKVDNLIIGGGMTYTFIKAKGGKIGSSLVEDDKLETALDLIKKAKENNVNLILPVDNVIADKFDNDADTKVTKIDEVDEGWMGLDIAEDSIELFDKTIQDSKLILWNGPMGVFEMPNFQEGTKKVAESVAKATKNGAFSLVGGGDSVAAVNKFGHADNVSYVSTGGGAMLEFLEGKTLPGIAAIKGE